jgi:TRAP-type C4-dicarboxylate transport system permease small subunit
MSRESTVILLGVLVAVSPFTGLPLSLLSWVLPILGALLVLIGITLRALSARTSTHAHEPEAIEAA